MKHILKYTISCLCLVYSSVIGFCADTFPITKTLQEVPTGYIEDLHKFLCKKVLSNGEDKELAKRNLFACAFVIKTEKGSQYVCYVDKIDNYSIKGEGKFFVELFGEELLDGEQNKNFRSQVIQTLKKKEAVTLNTNLSDLIFKNGTFMSCDQVPIYCLQKENLNIDSLLAKTYEILRKEPSFQKNIHQILFFDSMILLRKRSEPFYRKYNSDSELHALYILEQNTDKIADCFKKLLQENEQITSIEFHGCTTQDMCVFCYTNMTAMQFLANKEQPLGLLGKLIKVCKDDGITKDLCQSVTFISSIKEFPEKNLLMSNDTQGVPVDPFTGNLMVKGLPNGFVYQFRFSNDVIKALGNADEVQLKKNADIRDLDLKENGGQK